jgi:type VI protein secretion system component Hcp
VSTGTEGSGGETGVPDVSDLSVTVPLSAAVLRFLRPLNIGQRVNSLSLEMCRSDEVTGHCILKIELTNVFVTGLDYVDSPTDADATAVLTFAPEIETISSRTTRSVTYDLGRRTVSDAGAVPTEASSPFLTSLTGPAVDLATKSWLHAISSPTTAGTGGGGLGAGRVDHEPVTVVTHTGPGTVELLNRLLRGTTTETATISGCGASACTQSVELGNVNVTKLVLSSPNLTDKVGLTYSTIGWDRADDTAQTVFRWDLAGNREL